MKILLFVLIVVAGLHGEQISVERNEKISNQAIGVAVVGWERISKRDRELYKKAMKKNSIEMSMEDLYYNAENKERNGTLISASNLPKSKREELINRGVLGDGVSFIFIAGH